MGRAAIGTSFREDKTARKVTLSKRKKGIYKKCLELSSLCGVEMAIICVGDYCKPSAFVSTPTGPQEDLASTYRVVQRFSDSIGAQMPVHGQPGEGACQEELNHLRARCKQLEDELAKYRTIAAIQDSGQPSVRPAAVMQQWPPALGGAPGEMSLGMDPADMLAADLTEGELQRLSGRMSGMNISFGGIDTMDTSDLTRMSLDADVRRVSKELSDTGSDADALNECRKVDLGAIKQSRTTEELLAAFVNEGGDL